jgi:Ca2+-binding RTX toxin-like protein
MKKTKISIIIAIAILQTILMLSVQPAAFAEKIEGDEGPNTLIGTPGNDKIDSKGGNDRNIGDTEAGDGSGDDKINSGEGL